MYRGSIYEGQRNSTASRMGSYGGGAFSTGMEIGEALRDRIEDNDGKIGKYKGLDILQRFKPSQPKEISREGFTTTYSNPEKQKVAKGRHGYDQSVPQTITEELQGHMPAQVQEKKNYIGKRPGIDFLQDDKGLFQGGKYAGPSMKDAFGGIRKYFGDRLGSMQKQNAPATGDGNVKNTVVETAPPTSVNANVEGTQEGADIMEAKMADYRSRDWDPSAKVKNEQTGIEEYMSWYDPSKAEQYGWIDGKWQDQVQKKGILGALLGR